MAMKNLCYYNLDTVLMIVSMPSVYDHFNVCVYFSMSVSVSVGVSLTMLVYTSVTVSVSMSMSVSMSK
jgi:hypothetical protein